MEQIIYSILLLVLLILELILFFILMVTVFPKLLKVRCSVRKPSDRGLKKYLYPSGRGIAYEPHPSFRKYIHRYILFTNDGYKYVKCKLDESIERLNYSVVMFNRRNKVIDVIDVAEKNCLRGETQAVLLHPDTSYVAIVPDSVNDLNFDHKPLQECRVWRLSLYSLCVATLSFAQMLFLKAMLQTYDEWWFHTNLMESLEMLSFLLPAVCIGLIAGGWTFLKIRAKGIRWC